MAKAFKVRSAPRSQDELILHWISLRERGVRLKDIVAQHGHGNTQQNVSTFMGRVRNADLEEGPAFWGDDKAEIEARYW